MHCYILVIKILEKYQPRASISLDFQGSNLQLYKIRGLSGTNMRKLGQHPILAKKGFFNKKAQKISSRPIQSLF